MNILLAISTPDGANYLAFELETLNQDLPTHKAIYDAIVFAMEEEDKPLTKRAAFEVFSQEHGLIVSWGEILYDGYFLDDVLQATGMYSDPETEEYDPRYRNLTMDPPFHIDVVLKVRNII
jgi:hypothetical protein